MTVEENLLENLFDKNAVLFEEPSNLLKQELREPAMYNAVVTAAASGKTKLSEIASTVGVETGLCTKYIANLITLGIIKRETPVTDPNSKRPIYLIEDQFFVSGILLCLKTCRQYFQGGWKVLMLPE